MKKKILFRCLRGAPIGVMISLILTVIFSLNTGNGEYFPAPHELVDWCGNELTAVIVQLICSLSVGATFGGASVIWAIEKWSLLKQTLVHLSVVALPYFGLGYIMNWMPHYLYGALGYAGGFILVYAIIWCSMYFSMKAKIKQMNMQLQEMQQEDTQGTNL